MAQNLFVQSLLKWYKINKRDLPWRETKDPYFIWLSEIILQQTRVNQGLPYYIKFTETFPDIQALAKAKEQQVLRLWQGLGYYSRARNLLSSARTLVKENRGILPGNFQELLKIKGIGPYTAADIASFAYKERVPVVDGNVFRVLSRVFGIDTDIASPAGKKEFTELAWTLIPEKNPDIFNQAIMEFGALQCVPSKPDCADCPVANMCFAKKNNLQNDLPVKIKTLKKKTRHFNYLLIKHQNKILFKERKEKDIWKGLYDFPCLEDKSLKNADEIKKQFNQKKTMIDQASEAYKHILSHQTIHAVFYTIEVKDLNYFNSLRIKYNCKEFSQKQLKILPKPVLINKFLTEYNFL